MFTLASTSVKIRFFLFLFLDVFGITYNKLLISALFLYVCHVCRFFSEKIFIFFLNPAAVAHWNQRMKAAVALGAVIRCIQGNHEGWWLV